MMSDTRPGAGGPPPPTHTPLRRSRDDRMIAGVCGGIGRATGIDPVIYRITLGVLAVFAGVGILLYGLAWLLIPEENAEESEGQRLLRGRSSTHMALAVILALVGAALLGDMLRHGVARGAEVLIVLGVFAAIVGLQRRGSHNQTAPPSPSAAYAPPLPTDPAPQPAANDTAEYVDLSGGDWRPPAETVEWNGAPAEPRRRRSALAPLIMSAALLLVGCLVGLDAAGVHEIGTTTVLASALAILGLGLVIGAWLGRARGLIWVGCILTVMLVSAAALDVPMRGGTGDREWMPTAVSQIESPYRLGAGDAHLDLSHLPGSGAGQTIEASVGLGQLRVVVPQGVDVVVHARTGAGDLRLFGTQRGGLAATRTITDPAQTPVSAGTLRLNLRVGLGKVEVVRANS